ncbi:MAG: hypothetical protein H7Y86_16620 [Rhizobacter sp.]|nr:hypothetical protein [Ferruginibacter sp.]
MKKFFFSILLVCTCTGIAFAQTNKVMLSEACLYLGSKSYLEPGAYLASQMGIRDNKLSSFNIPKGMALQVFDLDNYGGTTETFYSSVICLNASWKNKVSSLKVFFIDDPSNGGGNTTMPIEENSGTDLPPQGDKVIFYKDIKYSGMSRKIATGSFATTDLGFLSGQISSVYIPYGLLLNITDNAGRSYSFSGSQSALSQYGWDNRIVSGSIQPAGSGGGNTLPPQGDKVIFYGDVQYAGMAKAFTKGSFSPADLGFLLQNISSIYIPAGLTVKVYNTRSGNRTFTTSIPNLATYSWDNQVSTGIISGTAGSGPLPPQGDKVIFYRDSKYSGYAKEFAAGKYKMTALGTLANNISSIYIPYGWSIEVKGQNGNSQTFNSSMSTLSKYGWDNMITSVSISSGGQQGGNGPGQGNTVNLYTETSYRGNATACGEGAIANIGIGADNNISSIQVPSGFAVTVYDETNLSGANITFRASVNNLATYGWNKKISSVYVFRL